MADPQWARFLQEYFEVPAPEFKDVYVLGSFAGKVTLYSQQVRALNLIFALHESGKLLKNAEIAIIGAGAGGITAAAGAAFCGAKVTVFDELEGPLELQRNNRQRWIHPHIYDWPHFHLSAVEATGGDEARLPLLSWSAGYAANVASEIIRQWEFIESAYPIDTHWSVDKAEIRKHKGALQVRWLGRDTSSREQSFSHVILAVGFGLEPERSCSDSYWAEDDIDGSFKKRNVPLSWLISGCGDGALTDLMRIYIHRFRQDEMMNLFAGARSIQALRADFLYELPKAKNPRDFFDALSIDSELRDI